MRRERDRDVEDEALDDPGERRRENGAADSGGRAQARVLDREHAGHGRARGAERAQDRRFGQALPATGHQRSRHHREPGRDAEERDGADRERDLSEDAGRALEDVAHGDDGHVGERGDHRVLNAGLRRRGHPRGGHERGGRALQRSRREDHEEVGGEGLPVDLANAGDACVDPHALDVEAE